MSQKKKIAVISICILVATAVTLLWMSSLKSSQPTLVEVITVSKPILRGYPFTEDNLSTLSIDIATVTEDMITDKEELLGKFATKAIDPGIPVLKSYAGESFLIRNLSEGMVPVRVPVDARTGNGVIPGDRVNILVTVEGNDLYGIPTQTYVLAHNVKVLALLYDTGLMEDEESVKRNEAEGKPLVRGAGTSSIGVIEALDSTDIRYPSLVAMEVTPDISRKIQTLIADGSKFALELDPWRDEQIRSLKEILENKMATLINGGYSDFPKFKDEYDKVIVLKDELLYQNGGVNYEKEFFLRLVRSQITAVRKVNATTEEAKSFIVNELNLLAQDLSNLNSGWWKIEDEINNIREYVEKLGGQFNLILNKNHILPVEDNVEYNSEISQEDNPPASGPDEEVIIIE